MTRRRAEDDAPAAPRLRTLAVSGAAPPTAAQTPVALPIVQSSTFVMDAALIDAMAAGDYRTQHLYSRHSNPTTDALQERLAAMHGGEDCVVFASGAGAVTAALVASTRERRTVVADTVLYGATTTLMRHYLADMGRRIVLVDFEDDAALRAALDANAGDVAVVYGETLSNPLVRPLDIPRVAALADAAGATFIVDNTFANPAVCRPLQWGAHLVVESLSKSIAGHSDVHGGAVVGDRGRIAPIWHAMIHTGACLDPHAAFLVWRGAKTLALRTDASQSNARAVAEALRRSPEVARVYFPDDTERAWLAGAGSTLSFVVRGGDAAAARVLAELRVVVAATSLGGVESLASLPHNTSHRTAEARALVGLMPGTVRLSVGCEDPLDLVADVLGAIERGCA